MKSNNEKRVSSKRGPPSLIPSLFRPVWRIIGQISNRKETLTLLVPLIRYLKVERISSDLLQQGNGRFPLAT